LFSTRIPSAQFIAHAGGGRMMVHGYQ